jgi:hypothetical protein
MRQIVGSVVAKSHGISGHHWAKPAQRCHTQASRP